MEERSGAHLGLLDGDLRLLAFDLSSSLPFRSRSGDLESFVLAMLQICESLPGCAGA